ncbi:cytochrome P450 [Actinomycetospora sp. NBRC 106378]|uniref:cytochrome P450 n=1 Tax=Actinomycetospora sp. NBRC 106378 TaxID=3032208 RepID=UPI0024A5601B|nr:cytochrome P450 [Actinomycetospora sp. NBRC 106378]GLZ52168.1 cytochrome P450 [Actinomycetospora sp. NBRC 106378]
MTASGAVRFNPFDPAFRADPYPQYRALREHAPVHRAFGMWVLTRHADVTVVLRDRTASVGLVPDLVERQTARSAARTTVAPESLMRISRLARTSLVFTDDPAHQRLRALTGRTFGPRTLEALRPGIVAEARRLATALRLDGGGDAVTDLAAPLPLAVLVDALGLPPERRGDVADWTHRIRFLLEPGLLTADDLPDVADAVDAFAATLHDVAAARRRDPREDLLGSLAAARTPDGDRLDDEELVLVAIMTCVAGLETTAALLGNGLHALLAHPDQAALLRAEPHRLRDAVAELLRFDSPLQLTRRATTRETVLGDAVVPAGASVLLCLGAANRDPEVFVDPDVLDVTRTAGAHLAYGRGLHGCVGASLASLVAEVALRELLLLPGTLRPAGPVTWQEHSQIVRAVAHLPVVLR